MWNANSRNDIWKTLQNRILIFGGFLTALAFLIIAFPALIAILAAGFLLMVGVSTLALGYKVHQFRKNPASLGFRPADDPYMESRVWPRTSRRTVYMYTVQ